jgi:hypothetical protein
MLTIARTNASAMVAILVSGAKRLPLKTATRFS